MAELNRAKMRLLGNYNSLLDENLAEYFSNPRIRRHLIRAGLIRKNGDIVSPEDYKARVQEEQRWLASQAFLAQAIVQRALDLEFSRRAHLQKQLEEIIRLELVERIRSARHKTPQTTVRSQTSSMRWENQRENLSHKKVQSRPHSESTAELSKQDSATYDIDASAQDESDPDSASSDNKSHSSTEFALQKKTRATHSANSRLQEKSTSPYSIPLMNGKNRPFSRTRSASYYMKSRLNLSRKGILNFLPPRAQTPGPKNVQYSTSEITLRFLGTRCLFSSSVNGGRQDVLIRQQLAGGNPVVVFYEPLIPGSVFSFPSKRYVDFPFSVTIYVDNILALKLSACCEYKYTIGYRLGGPQGYFMLLGVNGSGPCQKCNPRKKNKSSLFPPVKKRLPSGHGTIFKSSCKINKPTWSQRPFSAKKVALIPPTGKSTDKMLNTKDNSSWVLNVGILPCVETNIDNLKCYDDAEYGKESTHVEYSKEKENLSEDEITEEIISELQRTEKDNEFADEVEEELENKSSKIEEVKVISEDSDSNSTTGSSSGSSYTSGSSSASKDTAVEGPKIQVTKVDGTQRSSISSSKTETGSATSGSTSSGSSSSGSGSESDDEDNKNQFLKPEDAKIITKSAIKKTTNNQTKVSIDEIKVKAEPENLEISETKEKENILADKRNLSLQKMVAIDSSDEDESTSTIQKTVVLADVHNTPKSDKNQNGVTNENNKKDADNKKPVVTQDSLTAENMLERQQSLTVGNVTGTSSGRRNSIYQIVRNASEDADKDFNDMESQSSSVQDNGNEIEVIGQDLSGQINELCEELQLRPDLVTLTISKGGIDDLNIVPVIDALIYSKCPLKSLNLNYNHLGPQAGQQIARLVREKPTLNYLFLRANPLHDSGLCPIVNALLAHNSAFNLQDSDASFGLRTLDVGNCNFRNEGATNLASLIEQSRYLNTLILTGNNQLNDDDWSSIFWAIGQNSEVCTLFFDYCYIGDEGVECLAKIVRDHPSLEAVDLEWNQIGDEGAKILLTWIKRNPKVTQLRIECGNTIKDTIIEDINKALENNEK